MPILPEHLRPEPGEYPPYFDVYFIRLPDGDLFDILAQQPRALRDLLGGLDADQQLSRYADGKWSVKEVVGHIIDTERIFAYRGLRIMRGDVTPLSGFDQDTFVASAAFDGRSIESLLGEFDALRRSNVLLFEGHSPETYVREGVASDHRISLRAILNVLVAHVEHHMSILWERYLSR